MDPMSSVREPAEPRAPIAQAPLAHTESSLGVKYAVALASVVVAVVLKLTILAALEPGFTTLFIAAVALSAWYGGLGPGIFATTALSVASAYFLNAQIDGFAFEASLELARVLVFGLVGIFVSSLSAAVRRAQVRAENSRQIALAELAQRERAESALLVSEAHNRLIVESVREYAIFTLDIDGRVATWSSGAENLFGYTAKAARATSFEAFCSPQARERGEPAHALADAREFGVHEDAAWRARADGTEFFAECAISPLQRGPDDLIGYVVFVRDRTAARAAESRIRALHEGYREFVTWTSHEISEPARSAETLLEYLAEALPADVAEETRALADGARRNLARIKALLQALRSYEDIAEAHTSTRVDVSAVVRRVVGQELGTLVADRGADIVIKDLPAVRGDEERVARVFKALIENAIVHNPGDGPRVEVRGEVTPRGARTFHVIDNGPGIPKDRRDEAFRAFAKGSDTTRESTRPGMGLTLAQNAVYAMGGDIEIHNAPSGSGCEIRFTLPAPAPPKRLAESAD